MTVKVKSVTLYTRFRARLFYITYSVIVLITHVTLKYVSLYLVFLNFYKYI